MALLTGGGPESSALSSLHSASDANNSMEAMMLCLGLAENAFSHVDKTTTALVFEDFIAWARRNREFMLQVERFRLIAEKAVGFEDALSLPDGSDDDSDLDVEDLGNSDKRRDQAELDLGISRKWAEVPPPWMIEPISQPLQNTASVCKKNGMPPPANLQLEWVYGTSGSSARNACRLLATGEAVYFVGSYVVLYSSQRHEQRYYRGHRRAIGCLDVNASGEIVATGDACSDSTTSTKAGAEIHVWNARTLQCLAVLRNFHPAGVAHVSFPAAASAATATLRQTQALSIGDRSGAGGNSSAVLSSNLMKKKPHETEALIASIGSDDGASMALWNWQKEAVVVSGRAHPAASGRRARSSKRPLALALNEDGDEIVVVGAHFVVFHHVGGRFFKHKKPHWHGTVDPPLQTVPVCLSAVYYGIQTAVIGTARGELLLFERHTLTRCIQAHDVQTSVNVCMLSCQSMVLFSAGKDGQIKQWDSTLRPIGQSLDLHALLPVPEVTPSSSTVIRPESILEGDDFRICSLDYDAQRKRFLVATRAGNIFEIDDEVSTSTDSFRWNIVASGHTGQPTRSIATASTVGGCFASCGVGNKFVKIWSLRRRAFVQHLRFTGSSAAPSCLEFSSDGERLAVGSEDGTVMLARRTGTASSSVMAIETTMKNTSSAVVAMRFGPLKTEPLLAVARDNGLIYLYKLEPGRRLSRCMLLKPQAEVTGGNSSEATYAHALDFSVDGAFLRTQHGSMLYFWDLRQHAGTRVASVTTLRNVQWHTHNTSIGWEVGGLLLNSQDNDRVVANSTRGLTLVLNGDGDVDLAPFPCPPSTVKDSDNCWLSRRMPQAHLTKQVSLFGSPSGHPPVSGDFALRGSLVITSSQYDPAICQWRVEKELADVQPRPACQYDQALRNRLQVLGLKDVYFDNGTLDESYEGRVLPRKSGGDVSHAVVARGAERQTQRFEAPDLALTLSYVHGFNHRYLYKLEPGRRLSRCMLLKPQAEVTGGNSSEATYAHALDFSVDGAFLRTQHGSMLYFWDLRQHAGTRVASVTTLRNVQWHTHNTSIGWEVGGLLLNSQDNDRVVANSTRGLTLVLNGDGDVDLAPFPCPPSTVKDSDNCWLSRRMPQAHLTKQVSLFGSPSGHPPVSGDFALRGSLVITSSQYDPAICQWRVEKELADVQPRPACQYDQALRNRLQVLGLKDVYFDNGTLDESYEGRVLPRKSGGDVSHAVVARGAERQTQRFEAPDLALTLSYVHGFNHRSMSVNQSLACLGNGSYMYGAGPLLTVRHLHSLGTRQRIVPSGLQHSVSCIVKHPSEPILAVGSRRDDRVVLLRTEKTSATGSTTGDSFQQVATLKASVIPTSDKKTLIAVDFCDSNDSNTRNVQSDLAAVIWKCTRSHVHTVVFYAWKRQLLLSHTTMTRLPVLFGKFVGASDTGVTFVSGGVDHLTFWDLNPATGHVIAQQGVFGRHALVQTMMCVVHVAPFVVTGGADGSVVLWESSVAAHTIQPSSSSRHSSSGDGVVALEHLQASQVVLGALRNGSLVVWKYTTARSPTRTRVSGGRIQASAFLQLMRVITVYDATKPRTTSTLSPLYSSSTARKSSSDDTYVQGMRLLDDAALAAVVLSTGEVLSVDLEPIIEESTVMNQAIAASNEVSEKTKVLINFSSEINDIALHPRDLRWASASSDGYVHVWNLHTNLLSQQQLMPSSPRSLAWSSTGEHLAVSLADGTVAILNGTTLEPLLQFSCGDAETVSNAQNRPTIPKWCTVVKYSPILSQTGSNSTRSWLALACRDYNIYVYSVENTGADVSPVYSLRHTFVGHTAPIEALDFSLDGEFLQSATSSNDRQLLRWALQKEPVNSDPAKDTASGWALSLAWSSTGEHLAVSLADGTVAILNGTTLEPLLQFSCGDAETVSNAQNRPTIPKWCTVVKYSPILSQTGSNSTRSWLALACRDYNIYVYSVENTGADVSPVYSLRHTFVGHTAPIEALDFSLDGEFLQSATSSNDRQLLRWALQKEPVNSDPAKDTASGWALLDDTWASWTPTFSGPVEGLADCCGVGMTTSLARINSGVTDSDGTSNIKNWSSSLPTMVVGLDDGNLMLSWYSLTRGDVTVPVFTAESERSNDHAVVTKKYMGCFSRGSVIRRVGFSFANAFVVALAWNSSGSTQVSVWKTDYEDELRLRQRFALKSTVSLETDPTWYVSPVDRSLFEECIRVQRTKAPISKVIQSTDAVDESDDKWLEDSLDSRANDEQAYLEFIYGLNPGATGSRNVFYADDAWEIVYAAGSCGVVYNTKTQTQLLNYNTEAGRQSVVSALAVHPKGDLVASGECLIRGSGAPEIVIWDANSGSTVVRVASKHQPGVLLLEFSPEGHRLASIGMESDHTLAIYAIAGGEREGGRLRATLLVTCKTSTRRVWGLSFGEDGELATCGDQHILFWQQGTANSGRNGEDDTRSTGLKSGLLTSHKECNPRATLLQAAHMSGRARVVVSSQADGSLYVWKDRVCVLVRRDAHGDAAIPALAVDRKHSLLYSAGADARICVWNTQLELVQVVADIAQLNTGSLPLINTSIQSLSVRDGHVLFSTAGSEVCELVGAGSTQKTHEKDWRLHVYVRGHANGLLCGLAVHPSRRAQFASAGDDGVVRLWDAATRSLLAFHQWDCVSEFSTGASGNDELRALAFSADGKHLAVGTIVGVVRVLTAALDGVVTQWSCSQDQQQSHAVLTLQYSVDGKFLAVGCQDGTVHVYNAASYRKTTMLRGSIPSTDMIRLDFARDRPVLRVQYNESDIRFWELGTWKALSPVQVRDTHWESKRYPSLVSGSTQSEDFNGAAMAVDGHATLVTSWAVTKNENFLLSTGGADRVVCQFRLPPRSATSMQ
ncbi:hypothetical protein PPTG_22559 [Phytophthora nicotianae INRA-310]|uniref:HELP domain-containing protein n=1 Tax=Phytophthora nicotianae (strain INRA-310) TaxID=761204 RepID=W2QFQ4_PHYN3|nr:hypothetical protein PPTG_22559 [Phytophthora nicotianae INRA-310]ETN12002.1 hypothetical protein PPTG_22559 [Phytophthora nicotianae INRA-310]